MKGVRTVVWFLAAGLAVSIAFLAWFGGLLLLTRARHYNWGALEFFGGLGVGCWAAQWDGWPRVERWFLG